MSLTLTSRAQAAVDQIAKEPNLVLEIDGVSTIYGALKIKKFVRIGDPDLEIGDPELNLNAFYIGGFNLVADQDNAITLSGTTTSIRQSLNIDKGQGASISTMAIALVDNGDITKLITPGEVIPDVLQAKCRVYLGFEGTAWPEDYITIFKGVVTDIDSDAGKILLNINHPDDKKRGTIFKQVESELSSGIDASVTTITLDSVNDFLQPITGPDASVDPAFKSYVRIDNELIQYTGISGFNLTGCTRGSLNTTAASHGSGASVASFYRLSSTLTDLALKIMASGVNGNYLEDLEATSFVFFESAYTPNTIYFRGVDIANRHNIVIGDYVTTSGASNGANNVSLKEIIDVVTTEEGSYIQVDGVSFLTEDPTSALVSFRSQFDTLPDGLKMANDEIDIAEHQRLNQLFLSNVQYDIYLKETIEDGKEFLEEQIYSPGAAYSLPRKSRASVGYHIGPIPGQDIQVINKDNLVGASKSKIKRSTNKQFFNEIVYKFDESALEEKFLSGRITISATSKNQIRGANKTLTIESKGLRTIDQGAAIALTQSNRRLKRYEFGAEVLVIQVTFAAGFNLEIGDIIVYDGTDLSLPDTKNGVKGIEPRFYEIQNKELNIKNGDVRLEMVDTNFNGAARYCLMSPSSKIASGASSTSFNVVESFSGRFGTFEFRKWQNIGLAAIKVRNDDFSNNSPSVIVSNSFNQFTVSPPLSFTPAINDVFELANYDDANTLDTTKLVYGFMRDSAFADGKPQYNML
jgi:hypothetical protein